MVGAQGSLTLAAGASRRVYLTSDTQVHRIWDALTCGSFSWQDCSFDLFSCLFNLVQLQGSMFLQGDLLISPNLNATTPSVGMQVNTPASMFQGLKVVSANTSSTALVVSVRMVFFVLILRLHVIKSILQ